MKELILTYFIESLISRLTKAIYLQILEPYFEWPTNSFRTLELFVHTAYITFVFKKLVQKYRSKYAP